MSEQPADRDARPMLRVVRGDASPEEVAALVAVLSSVGSAPAASARRPSSEWSAAHRRMRMPYPHGPGGWRSSALPRPL